MSNVISASLLIKNLVCALIFYIALEEFFLKWLPVSDVVFEGLHAISDLIIVLVVCLYLLIRVDRTRVDVSKLAWGAFIGVSLVSFLLSYAAFLGFFAKLWVLLRYILLYFILTQIKMSNRDINRFYGVLGITFAIQVCIGFLQLLDVQIFSEFFRAREGLEKVIVQEDTVKGPFKFGVFYGFLIMVSFVILYTHVARRDHKVLLAIAALLFTFYSGSRVAFIGVLGFLLYWHYRGNKILIGAMVSSTVTFVLASGLGKDVENLGSLLGLLSVDFWINSFATGRLGIFNIVPMFFDAGLKEILFGFSYDVNGITSFLYKEYNNLSAILRNNAIVGIEDVYWVAFLYYYGLFGLALFGIFYAGIMVKVKRLAKVSKALGISPAIRSFTYLLAFSVLCGFVNQVFYIKTYSFYFWVFLAVASHPVRYVRT